ncbi:hypothetical protein [Flavobacterium coralii]|uniref:hypothetical protein n=1 Tax=Flavobacterium coralii TaxID=2838017 RepID=UPI000C367B59|nr:hypothetical protein [Flavobacterium sp.]|tara:strand:- start:858 stop:1106 length:249 start_codon:yes stop_codon:yes gene_type:complete
MASIQVILGGWKNFIDKSEVTEEKARERADICAQCPNAVKGKLLAFIKDSLKEIEGYKCSVCDCPLSAKLRSEDICPIGKWE